MFFLSFALNFIIFCTTSDKIASVRVIFMFHIEVLSFCKFFFAVLHSASNHCDVLILPFFVSLFFLCTTLPNTLVRHLSAKRL